MSLSKSCKFLAATDGRDKLYKFFHYGARFLSWFCLNTANNAQWAKYWSNIDSVMSDGRKLLRLFKFLSEIEKLGTIREARPMLLVANLLKTLGMAGYFFFNNLSWAMKFNIVSGDEKKWGKLSFWAWTVGLLFALVLDVVKYRENSRRQQKALASSSQTELAQLKKEQRELEYAMIREVANLQISTSLVEINPIKSAGVVGLAGVVVRPKGQHTSFGRRYSNRITFKQGFVCKFASISIFIFCRVNPLRPKCR